MSIHPAANFLARQIVRRRWLARLGLLGNRQYGYVTHQGRRFYIYLQDRRGPSYHVAGGGLDSYEPRNIAVLKKFLGPGTQFVDVGANVGIFSFRLALETGTSVWAFEPEPTARRCLELSVEENQLDRVRVFPHALSTENGDAVLYVDGENHGGTSLDLQNILAEGNPVGARTTVSTRTFDSLVKEHGLDRLDVIKIDAQGHEAQVLAGAEASLRRFRPVVLVECSAKTLESPAALGPILNHGEWRIFDPLEDRHTDFVTARTKLEPRVLTGYSDLLFVPAEKSGPL